MSIRKRTWTTKGEPREAWVVNYTDMQGRRRLKTFKRKKDAAAWRDSTGVAVRQGTHIADRATKTVAEAAELWLADCEARGLERATLKQRREHVRLHINPYIGRLKLSALTLAGLHVFHDQLRNDGRSLAMRRKVMTNLSIILGFAQNRSLVAQNVAKGFKIGGDRQGKAPLRDGVDFPTRAELKSIMDTATGRWRPLVITAIFTGMRASELRGLTWTNVDLDRGVIHVTQRADAWGKIGPPKSAAGSREIPLAPMVVNTLREWKAGCPPGPLNLVFPSVSGTVVSHSNVLMHFWFPLQRQLGMTVDGKPKYDFHSLRHAAASLFIAHLQWTPKRVQVVMGHSSMQMTYDRYGHLFADHESDQAAMARLQAAVIS